MQNNEWYHLTDGMRTEPYKKCNMDCRLGISNDYNEMQVLLHLNCRIALIIRIIFVIMLMKIKRG